MSGDAGCGKSILLLHLLSRCLLPTHWKGLHLGGCDAGAIVIDTDLRFNILQLSVMMELFVKRKIMTAKKNKIHSSALDAQLPVPKGVTANIVNDSTTDSNSLSNILKMSKKNLKAVIKDLIKISLEKLVYLRCYHSKQFAITLLSLDHVLAAHPLVSLVCIDSVSSFYWYDRIYHTDTWQKSEQYYNNILTVFLSLLQRSSISVFGVKQSLFSKFPASAENFSKKEGKSHFELDEYNYLGKAWQNAITYSINIRSDIQMPNTTFRYQQHKELVPSLVATGAGCSKSMYPQDSTVPAGSSHDKPKLLRPVYTMTVDSKEHKKSLSVTFHEDGIRWAQE